MPAKAPASGEAAAQALLALGASLRAHRKRLGVTAIAAAESAGMSRVTLHRIEQGEPSVTMGAYMGAAAVLGLTLGLVNPSLTQSAAGEPGNLPARIRLAEFPQLRQLAWQRDAAAELTPAEALNLYERNWRHVEPGKLSPQERALIDTLAATVGGGRLLV